MSTTTSAPSVPPASLDFISLGGNFLLVLVLLVAVLWAIRRLQGIKGLQGFRPVQRRLSIVEALSVGPRQKMALIKVDDREVLVGLTPNGFTLLSVLPPTATDGAKSPEGAASGANPGALSL